MMPLAPGTVVDDDLLSETLRQLLRHEPADEVGRTAGCEADDETNRTLRIAFRSRRGRVHGGRAECDRRKQTTDRGFRNHHSSPGVLTKSR